MSTPDKPDTARAWRHIERMIDEEDTELAEAAAGAHPEEVPAPGTEWSVDDLWARADAEGRKQEGAGAGQVASSEPAAPKASPAVETEPAPSPAPAKVAPVVPIRRTWRTLALLAAACFALFIVVKATQGPGPVVHPPPSDREIAEADRDLAEARCALNDWAGCKARLDEAATLDPAGEGEPRVKKAREAIAAGVGQMEKPGP